MLHRLLFNNFWKSERFQGFFGKLNYWCLHAMNYGGGGDLRTSGEEWYIKNHLAKTSHDPAKNPVVFDVGANEGGYTELIKLNIPSAQVFAFEPVQKTYIELTGNTALMSGVTTLPLALSDKGGEGVVYSYNFEGNPASVLGSMHERLPTQHGRIEVASEETIKTSTVDDVAEQYGLDNILLLKLDVEGHELSVLKGARRMILERRINNIQFEFGPANLYSRTSFFDFWELLSPNYRIFRLLPSGLSEISYYEERNEIYLTTNYIATLKTG